ncbi:hypothetical protein NMG60_11029241 [Bertholletia excelsa]
MATSSPSSAQDQPSPAPNKPSSRRLPPPCWSHDETVALIDAYREKWYSLRRGNLRAPHWQEVADAVAERCPVAAGNPAKTSVQCRHKMEKLRKRYRTEIQRSASVPNGHRFASSWVHFKRMDSMEKGPSANAVTVYTTPVAAATSSSSDEGEDNGNDEEDEDEELYQSVKNGFVSLKRKPYGSVSNGFRIKIPGRSGQVPAQSAKIYGKSYQSVDGEPNFGVTKVVRDGYSERLAKSAGNGDGVGKKRPVEEMVAAIKALGDGFVRMERMKMEMAKEVEAMRMEMEMKRTEMILESQQRIVEAFAKAFSEKRSKKSRMPTPES